MRTAVAVLSDYGTLPISDEPDPQSPSQRRNVCNALLFAGGFALLLVGATHGTPTDETGSLASDGARAQLRGAVTLAIGKQWATRVNKLDDERDPLPSPPLPSPPLPSPPLPSPPLPLSPLPSPPILPLPSLPPLPPTQRQGSSCPQVALRKSWDELTDDEKQIYYDAVWQLKRDGTYEHFARVHMQGKNAKTSHLASHSHPWHRKFILEFENAVRNYGGKYECFTLPYWNLARDLQKCLEDPNCNGIWDHSKAWEDFGGGGDPSCATAPFAKVGDESFIEGTEPGDFYTIYCDRQPDPDHCRYGTAELYGSGGCGSMHTSGAAWGPSYDPSKSEGKSGPTQRVGCVTKGAFKGWTISPHWPQVTQVDDDFSSFRPTTCISRRIATHESGAHEQWAHVLDFVSNSALAATVIEHPEWGSDTGFRFKLEMSHNAMHGLMGGGIDALISVHDPIFFVYHAFIDKVYAVWQDCHGYDRLTLDEAPAQCDSHGYDHHTLRHPAEGSVWLEPLGTDPSERACSGGRKTRQHSHDVLCAQGFGTVDDRCDTPMSFSYPDAIDRCWPGEALGMNLDRRDVSPVNGGDSCYQCVVDNYADDCTVRGLQMDDVEAWNRASSSAARRLGDEESDSSPLPSGGAIWDLRCSYMCSYPLCAETCGGEHLKETTRKPEMYISTWSTLNMVSDFRDTRRQLGYEYSSDALDDAIEALGECPSRPEA